MIHSFRLSIQSMADAAQDAGVHPDKINAVCDSHEDLVDAARWALSILSDIRDHEDWEMSAVAESVENLSAAIAKAEGGAS